MSSIQKISRRLQLLFLVLYYLVPIMYVVYWSCITEDSIRYFSLTTMPLEVVVLNPTTRVLAFLAMAMPMGFLMFIFHQMAKIFAQYGRGVVFCLSNAQTYKNVGLALFGLALVNLIADSLVSVVLSYQSLGQRILSVGIGVGQVYPIIFGLALYIISYIMEEAHRIDQEQKYTI